MTGAPHAGWRATACALLLVAGLAMASGCGDDGGAAVAPASQDGGVATTDDVETSAAPIAPISIERVPIGRGQELEFVVVLPPGYTKDATYPIAVAMPPGDQQAGIAESVVQELFFQQARDRGWLVISPIAPEGRLFFDGSYRLIPRLLKHLESRFRPEGGKYHLTGLSNGGVGAFKLALYRPRLFHSLLVYPGFPRGEKDIDRLQRLRDTPVRMIVGQHDAGWVEPMRRTDVRLRLFGVDATLQVEPGEGHFIGTVNGMRLFNTLEPLRKSEEPDEEAVVSS